MVTEAMKLKDACSLEEMGKLLQKYNLPKLNQKEMENLNRPITSMETKDLIKIFQQKKSGIKWLHR